MRLHKLAVALAAISFAGAAAAAGNTNGSMTNSSHDQMTTRQTSPQSTQQSEASTNRMGSTQSNAAQGSAAGDENNPTTVRSAQQALKQKGFDVRSIDGQMGPNTESALRSFQQSQGLAQTGTLDQRTLSALGVNQNEAGISSEGSSYPGSSSSQNAISGQGSSSPGATSGLPSTNAKPDQETTTQNGAYK